MSFILLVIFQYSSSLNPRFGQTFTIRPCFSGCSISISHFRLGPYTLLTLRMELEYRHWFQIFRRHRSQQHRHDLGYDTILVQWPLRRKKLYQCWSQLYQETGRVTQKHPYHLGINVYTQLLHQPSISFIFQ